MLKLPVHKIVVHCDYNKPISYARHTLGPFRVMSVKARLHEEVHCMDTEKLNRTVRGL